MLIFFLFRCQYPHWNLDDSLLKVKDFSDFLQDVL